MSDYISVSAFDADLHRRMGREEIDTFCLDHMRRALSESEIPGNATQEQYVAGRATPFVASTPYPDDQRGLSVSTPIIGAQGITPKSCLKRVVKFSEEGINCGPINAVATAPSFAVAANAAKSLNAAGAMQPVQAAGPDPQTQFLGEACLFVANIDQDLNDGQIISALHDVFDMYGRNHIKVRRNNSTKQPFAFVQFEVVTGAKQAIKDCNGRVVGKRSIRVEEAESRRFWFVARQDGSSFSADDIQGPLSGEGPYRATVASAELAMRFGKGYGIVVVYTHWNEYRDLGKVLPGFYVRAISKTMAESVTVPVSSTHTIVRSSYFDLDRDTQDRTVYIRDLPTGVSHANVSSFAERVGPVTTVELHNSSLGNTYAYATYANADHASQAIAHLHGKTLNGLRVSVDRRDGHPNRQERNLGQITITNRPSNTDTGNSNFSDGQLMASVNSPDNQLHGMGPCLMGMCGPVNMGVQAPPSQVHIVPAIALPQGGFYLPPSPFMPSPGSFTVGSSIANGGFQSPTGTFSPHTPGGPYTPTPPSYEQHGGFDHRRSFDNTGNGPNRGSFETDGNLSSGPNVQPALRRRQGFLG